MFLWKKRFLKKFHLSFQSPKLVPCRFQTLLLLTKRKHQRSYISSGRTNIFTWRYPKNFENNTSFCRPAFSFKVHPAALKEIQVVRLPLVLVVFVGRVLVSNPVLSHVELTARSLQ